MSAIERGQVLCGCTVERELGRGAMGRVFLAREASGRRVALKVMERDFEEPRHRARVYRELRIARKLDHPGIVRVLRVEARVRPGSIIALSWSPRIAC